VGVVTGTPFDATTSSIPVTIIAHGELPTPGPGVTVLTLEPKLHEHDAGKDCPACVARGDVRAMLFDLLTEVRLKMRPAFRAVLIDARRVAAQPVVDRLDPHAPAMALRDHTVARSFHLSRVI
jgi:hypothetical protein